MDTKLLLMISAGIMTIVGVLFIFIPESILTNVEISPSGMEILFLQISGVLYLSLAVTNWMARGASIGGIYGKAISLGNFFHFIMGSLLTLKYVFTHHASLELWIGTVIYAILAILFTQVTFMSNPTKVK